MNTPTHLLMTAALRKALPRWKMVRSAVLWGSMAPDLPLYALSIGGLVYFHKLRDWPLSNAAQHIFGTLYFAHPVWIALHNVLHSPLSLGLLWALNHGFRRQRANAANWCDWFLLACLLHSLVDIVTHHDDGPLLLWPLDWQWRFESPVSYWDHRYYGRETARVEALLCVGLLIYLTGPWVLRVARKRLVRGRRCDTPQPEASSRG